MSDKKDHKPAPVKKISVKILFIENNEADIKRFREFLKKSKSITAEVVVEDSLADGIKRASEENVELVFLDLALPDSHGVDTLIHARIHIPLSVPIIVITGKVSDDLIAKIAQEGAQDVISKEDTNTEKLTISIERAIQRGQAKLGEMTPREQERYAALYDSLTNLPNRQLLEDRLVQSIKVAHRHSQQLAILYIDIDRFNQAKKKLGDKTADKLLRSVSHRLIACIRGNDTIARIYNDDFIVVLNNISHTRFAARIAQNILKAVTEKPYIVENEKINLTASIGISVYPVDGESTEDLIRKADTALFQVRKKSGNNYQFVTQAMNAAAFERLVLENRLEKAITDNEFCLEYQPQVSLADGSISGAEALIRWRHPYLGLVYPGDFIQLAEETGQIDPIGKWVLWEACRQNKAWQDEGYPKMRISVNLSSHQFLDKKLVDTIVEILEKSDLDPKYLGVEITESIAMQDIGHTFRVLKVLQEMDIDISVDDFGIGYSSLNYLKNLPMDVLKIHQSFVTDISSSPEDMAISKAIIYLAHALSLKVVAEGVETEDQLVILRELKCDRMQGFYFSKAVPPEVFSKYLALGKRL